MEVEFIPQVPLNLGWLDNCFDQLTKVEVSLMTSLTFKRLGSIYFYAWNDPSGNLSAIL